MPFCLENDRMESPSDLERWKKSELLVAFYTDILKLCHREPGDRNSLVKQNSTLQSQPKYI